MAITFLRWVDNAAQDVHLIPGYVGPRLSEVLWAAQTVGDAVRADKLAAPITVAFAANFTASPATANVAVDASNGRVTVKALPPPPRLLDFVVTATVTEGTNVFRAHRRFRIHGDIVRSWLTPDPLSVRQNARNIRFTVLAEFEDGTYGDLTDWSPWDAPAAAERSYVSEIGSDDPAITWSTSAAGTVGVDSATGRLAGAAASGSATITATVGPLPAPAARIATGVANAARPWSDPTLLWLVDGPGFDAIPDVTNVLILPDGFVTAERGDFERVASQFVQRLRVRQRTRPFDLVKDGLNYFLAWVSSRQGGISPLDEIRRSNVVGTSADAEEVDLGLTDATVPGAWHVAAPPSPATNDRFLLNEQDTAFHVALGERPSAQRLSPMRGTGPNIGRFDEEDFDAFLKALHPPGAPAVGATWARGGADEQMLLILCHSNRKGGANHPRENSGRVITLTLDNRDTHRIKDKAGGRGKDLVPDPIAADVSTHLWTAAGHELAHSFTLGDEYGGGGAFPAVGIPTLAKTSNVQPRANLLTGADLDADKVKWRWPRLRAAGVLADVPAALGGNRFHVKLDDGDGRGFKRGDVVRFRLRPLLTAPPPTDRFIVVADPSGDELDVEALTAAPFAPATFVAGNVLISPVRAPDPDPANRVFGDDLELMHAAVRARINATRNPLNAADGDPQNRPCPGIAPPGPTAATNFPGGTAPNPPIYSSWIVGLYENGYMFDCDVYRPTGICLMRALHYVDATTDTERAYQLCPVCRYAMVDLVDPSKHGAIDADYAPRYPT